MAVQVVTSQNFQQLVETGRVDDFKPPEAEKPPENGAKTSNDGTKPANGGAGPGAGETKPARGADGKFTSSKEGDKTTPASSESPTIGDDDDEKDLPEVVRQKIGKKHRQMKEAEEFAKGAYRKQLAAEQQAEQLRQELEAVKKSGPDPAKAPAEEQEPKPDDFKTVGEYTDALVKYRVKKELAAEKDRAERQREEEAKAARAAEFTKRLEAAREKHDDFDVALQSLSGTDMDRVHTDVVEYLQESEHGANLLYHLAKNRDVLDRLRKLSPRRFIAELGKLESIWEKPAAPPEGKLSDAASAPAAAPVAISRAPAPMAALSNDKGTVVSKDPANMSFAELRAYERQREAERRARR